MKHGEIPACGTVAAYARHQRLGEAPCTPCRNANLRYQDQYRETNRERLQAEDRRRYHDGERRMPDAQARRESKLRANYGITTAQWNEIFEWQEYRCKCCGTCKDHEREKAWQVDHDHDTGVLRGIVCPRCNRLAAQSGDNAYGAAAAFSRLLAFFAASGDYLDDDQMEALIDALRGRRGLVGVDEADPDRAPRERHEAA